jgi:hypothetical protein
MSVDTHGIIGREIPLEEVYASVLGNIDPMAKFYRDGAVKNGDWVEIVFTFEGNNRTLSCGVFFNNEEEPYEFLETGSKYVWLSIGHWGNSEELMRKIIAPFGGWIDDNDCDGEGFYAFPECSQPDIPKVIRVTRKELNEKFGGVVIVIEE